MKHSKIAMGAGLWLGGSRFDLSKVEGFTLDLDPSSGAAVQITSSKISGLLDASPVGRDFAQATPGSRPTLGLINGLGAVDYDRNFGQYLVGPTLNDLTAFEMHAVMQVRTLPPIDNYGVWRLGNHASSDFYTFADGNLYTGPGSTTREMITPGIDLSVPHLYSVLSVDGLKKVWLNGVEVLSVDANTVAFDAAGSLLGATSAGGVTPAFFWDGLMGRIVAFDRDIGATTRTKVFASLMATWGIS